jgi:hypothetical protein
MNNNNTENKDLSVSIRSAAAAKAKAKSKSKRRIHNDNEDYSHRDLADKIDSLHRALAAERGINARFREDLLDRIENLQMQILQRRVY